MSGSQVMIKIANDEALELLHWLEKLQMTTDHQTSRINRRGCQRHCIKERSGGRIPVAGPAKPKSCPVTGGVPFSVRSSRCRGERAALSDETSST
ncbi:hypothetical protein EAO73_27440 [Streptomyces sp. col6]|nr:hypothetical protein EAO73_27440 [Streptomyces sp. col6]